MKMPFQPKQTAQNISPIGTKEAFNTFYTQTHLQVFRYIYGLHGAPVEDVEDLTAETYIRAWKSRRRFRGDSGAALGWILKIARNLVIDTHRKQKNKQPNFNIDDTVIPANENTPEEHLAQQELSQKLWRSLSKQPNHHREIIVLRYMLGWRVKQIAAHLDMNQNTVSVNIRRILERIRKDWPET